VNENKPTYGDIIRSIKSGRVVRLPDGGDGIFLAFGKSRKMSWVLKGGMDGPKVAVPTKAMLHLTFGV